MLGPKGPSVEDLMSLHTEMFVVLSRQLTVIQEGVQMILQKLSAIDEKLGRLPKEVTEEHFRSQLTGILRTYSEDMAAYKREKEKAGIPSAQALIAPRIGREVVEAIRPVRSILLAIQHSANAPLLAASLQAEIHGMTLGCPPAAKPDENYFRKENSVAILALDRYLEWFTAILPRVEKEMADVRAERASIREEVNHLPTKDRCVTEITSRPYPIPNGVVTGYIGKGWVLERSYKELRPGAFDTPEMRLSMERLVSSHYLEPSDAPVHIRADPVRRDDVEVNTYPFVTGGQFSSNPNIMANSQAAAMDYIKNERRCGNEGLFHDANVKFNYLGERLVQTGARAIMLASYREVAEAAKAGLERFIREVSK
jgi:hypothetical protein